MKLVVNYSHYGWGYQYRVRHYIGALPATTVIMWAYLYKCSNYKCPTPQHVLFLWNAFNFTIKCEHLSDVRYLYWIHFVPQLVLYFCTFTCHVTALPLVLAVVGVEADDKRRWIRRRLLCPWHAPCVPVRWDTGTLASVFFSRFCWSGYGTCQIFSCGCVHTKRCVSRRDVTHNTHTHTHTLTLSRTHTEEHGGVGGQQQGWREKRAQQQPKHGPGTEPRGGIRRVWLRDSLESSGTDRIYQWSRMHDHEM